MENLKNKKVLIAIVVVILVIWYFSSGSNNAGVNSITSTSTPAVATTTTTMTTTTVKKAVVPVANQPVTLSYENALKAYPGSLRIQLSGTSFCQANPTTVMYKNGTSIMVDNRAAMSRTIKIGVTPYTIEGYGFKIIKLSSSVLPTTLIMDCGTQQNIAKITLQK